MFNLSVRALRLKQKQEVSIKFTEVKRVSNCKILEYLVHHIACQEKQSIMGDWADSS